MNRQRQSKRAAAEASAWLARLDSGEATDDERREHEQWLAASSENRDEYAAVQAIFERTRWVADRELLALAEESPAPASWWNIFQPMTANRRAVWAGALATVACMALGVSWFVTHPSVQQFSTAVGETRMITLADGSTVTLNTDSVLRVPKWDQTRQVELQQGEAFFAIQRDPRLPFVVAAGGGAVRVLGTQFNIRLDEGRTTVTIVEGRVELSVPAQADAGSTQRVLVAGEAADFGGGKVLEQERPRVAQLTAWRTGKIVFDGARLEDVVREVNRYSKNKVTIADAAIKEERISATFATDRIPDLLQTLETAAPIRVITQDDAILIVAR
jgi:transmembrane sensor